VKTIAITIENETLSRIDRLARQGPQPSRNRSRLIREAVREYLARLEREAEDERETGIIRRHRARLAGQAAAAVRAQARS
jgi:metal-responsive CopG/Arc/MetJ family transcriptional regulator